MNILGNLQANAKEMFEDDDLDVSSGSDFDEDEDPDKIEVPGKFLSHFLSCSRSFLLFLFLFLSSFFSLFLITSIECYANIC